MHLDLVRIAHLSDLHIDGSQGRSLRLAMALARAKKHLALDSYAADRAWRDRVGRHLLLTGDLTSHGRMDEYAELGSVLNEHWPYSATIVPGNHDGGTARFVAGAKQYLPRFLPYSTPGLICQVGRIRILPVDTSFGNRSLLFRAMGNIGGEQLKMIAENVAVARAKGDHIVLAMHHGPHPQEGLFAPLKALSDRKRLLGIMAQAPGVVSVCCGHDHGAKDFANLGGGCVFVADSVATCEGEALRVYEQRNAGRMFQIQTFKVVL